MWLTHWKHTSISQLKASVPANSGLHSVIFGDDFRRSQEPNLSMFSFIFHRDYLQTLPSNHSAEFPHFPHMINHPLQTLSMYLTTEPFQILWYASLLWSNFIWTLGSAWEVVWTILYVYIVPMLYLSMVSCLSIWECPVSHHTKLWPCPGPASTDCSLIPNCVSVLIAGSQKTDVKQYLLGNII